MSSAQSGRSIPIIADNPSDRLNGSTVELENSAVLEGSGNGSHILFVSQNNSAENGGSNVAIDVKNTVSGDLLVYAGHGEIVLQNNINLREVTAWRVRAKNSAEIMYEMGFGSTLFPAGPGGSLGGGTRNLRNHEINIADYPALAQKNEMGISSSFARLVVAYIADES